MQQGLGSVQQQGGQPQEAAPFTFETAVKINGDIMSKANLDMKKAGLGKIDRKAISAVQKGLVAPELVFDSDKVSAGAKDVLKSDLGLA